MQPQALLEGGLSTRGFFRDVAEGGRGREMSTETCLDL